MDLWPWILIQLFFAHAIKYASLLYIKATYFDASAHQVKLQIVNFASACIYECRTNQVRRLNQSPCNRHLGVRRGYLQWYFGFELNQTLHLPLAHPVRVLLVFLWARRVSELLRHISSKSISVRLHQKYIYFWDHADVDLKSLRWQQVAQSLRPFHQVYAVPEAGLQVQTPKGLWLTQPIEVKMVELNACTGTLL